MESALSTRYMTALFSIVGGACFIFVCSLIKIPFYPVPMTMHTFAIFYLGLMQSPKNACGSALLFLAVGTLNPYWMIGKCGGYFLAFPIAAYLIAWSSRRVSPHTAVFLGQTVIYALGFIWLIPFVGVNVALMNGVIFFIPSALVKMMMAVYLKKIIP